MQTQQQAPIKRTYLSREESVMYDKEGYAPLVDTMNAARIEFPENMVKNIAGRRCDLIKIAPTHCVLALNTMFTVPRQFHLEIPDARISMIGCVLMRVNPNNTVEARFLRRMSDKDINRIYVYSTHPAHRNTKLDIRA
jgi:hypothetical protein